MRIDCPQCHAGYDLPPEKLPPGRTVRCARCTQLWTPVPLVAAQDTPPPQRMPELGLPAALPVEAVSAARGPDAAEAMPSALERLRLPGAWLATLLVLAALGWAAVSRRADIMQAWPPSERAYIALGLATRS